MPPLKHPMIPIRPYRKLKLTTKDVNKGFYKGTRTGSMGRHTKRGGYIIEYQKVRTYVVPPGLNKFKLTPFIANKVIPEHGTYPVRLTEGKGPRSPLLYLQRWKSENGVD